MSTTTIDRLNGINSGVAIKAPVRVATTASITLSGTQTIDGVAVVADDRVLVKNQTSGVNNGIYVCSTSAWQRDLDFDGARDVVTGTLVSVVAGSLYAGTLWQVTTTGAITPGTTSIAFSQSSLVASSVSLWKYSTTTTMADPATGYLRFNNAAPSSATALAISALSNDAGNPNFRSAIITWDDSTNTIKGTLTFKKLSAPSNFLTFSITGTVTDNTTWQQFTVANVASGGTLASDDMLLVSFVQAGDLGTGAPFIDSTAIIKGSADATKLLRFEVDGFTTATTRVLTPPNADGTIATLSGGNYTGAINFAAAVDVAASGTADIGAAASNTVRLTGGGGTTSLGTAAAGIIRDVYYSGATTLTHNATSLILPGGASITTAANDRFRALSLGSGNWIVLFYERASGLPIVASGGVTTQTAASSATLDFTLDFTTNIAYDFYINKLAPATDGASFKIQLTDDAVINWDNLTTHRGCIADSGASTTNNTSGFLFQTQDSDASPNGQLKVTISQPLTTSDPLVVYQGFNKSNSGVLYYVDGTMNFAYSAAVLGARFSYTAGNIATGTITMKPITR